MTFILVNKDVPDNVIMGVPARVIGDFEGFIKKRIKEGSIDGDSYTPDGEVIHEDYEKNCWNRFYEAR